MCVSRHDVRHMRFFNVILFKRKSTCSDNLLWRFPSKRILCQCVFASCFMKTLQSIVPSFLPRSTCTNPFAKPRFHYQPIQFFPSKKRRNVSTKKRTRMWNSSRSYIFSGWSHKPLLAHHMLRRSMTQPYKHCHDNPQVLPNDVASYVSISPRGMSHFGQGGLQRFKFQAGILIEKPL